MCNHIEEIVIANKDKIILPDLDKDSFSCPHCGVLSVMEKEGIFDRYFEKVYRGYRIFVCVCQNPECQNISIWVGKGEETLDSYKMIYPDVLTRFYLAVRPPIIGPFFIHFNGKSLTRYQFV